MIRTNAGSRIALAQSRNLTDTTAVLEQSYGVRWLVWPRLRALDRLR